MWTHLLLLLPLWFSCCLRGFYNWSDIVEIISSTRAPYLFFLPTTLVSDFSDKRCEALHYLPALQTLVLPHLPRCSYSHHPPSSDLLSSLVCVIKRRGRCSPRINGRSSANTSTSNHTEDFTTNEKVLIETLQPLPRSSSPSAPLKIRDRLTGTFSALQDLCHQGINVFSLFILEYDFIGCIRSKCIELMEHFRQIAVSIFSYTISALSPTYWRLWECTASITQPSHPPDILQIFTGRKIKKTYSWSHSTSMPGSVR